MSEALAFTHQDVIEHGDLKAEGERPPLYVVPVEGDNEMHKQPVVVLGQDDETGKVIIPAVVLSTKFMPNGQTVESFYDRNGRLSHELDDDVHKALTRAALVSSNQS